MKAFARYIREVLHRTDWKTFAVFVLLSFLYWLILHVHRPRTLSRQIIVRYGTPEALLPAVFSDTFRVRSDRSMSVPDTLILPPEAVLERHKEDLIRKVLEQKAGKSLSDLQIEKKSHTASSPGLKKAAVAWDSVLRPAAGYAIRNLRVRPAYVWIYGPPELVHSRDTVYLRLPREEVLAGSYRRLVRPALEPGLHSFPEYVEVEASAVPYVRETRFISLGTEGEKWKNYIFFPARVEVRYKKLADIPSEGRWEIVPEAVRKNDSFFFRPVIKRAPSGVFDIQIIPSQLDYLQIDESS